MFAVVVHAVFTPAVHVDAAAQVVQGALPVFGQVDPVLRATFPSMGEGVEPLEICVLSEPTASRFPKGRNPHVRVPPPEILCCCTTATLIWSTVPHACVPPAAAASPLATATK